MKPVLQEKFNGLIWQIRIDQVFDNLILEVRDQSDLSVHYFLLDFQTYRLRKLETPDQLNWFSTLIGSFGHRIVFSQYENETNPGPSKLIVWDTAQHLEINHVDKFVVSAIRGPIVEGYTLTENGTRKTMELNISDREERYGMNDLIDFPVAFRMGDADFQVVVEYLSSFNRIPVHIAEYLEAGDNIIFTYYLDEGKYLSHHMMWIQKGDVVLDQQIDTDLKGVSFESFLSYKKRVIFVQNRNELCIYES